MFCNNILGRQETIILKTSLVLLFTNDSYLIELIKVISMCLLILFKACCHKRLFQKLVKIKCSEPGSFVSGILGERSSIAEPSVLGDRGSCVLFLASRLLNNLFDLEAFTSLIIRVNEACSKKEPFCCANKAS